MKKLLRVGKSILTCAAFLVVAIILAVVYKSNKGVDPYEIFLLKAEIEGSKTLITENDRKISESMTFMGFKTDSIRNFEGNDSILKNQVEKLQADIQECQNAIVFYKKTIAKNTAILIQKK